MAKFYGTVGYAEQVKTSPGVFEEVIAERPAFGDVLSTARSLRQGEYLNSDISVTHTIEIIMDAYARDHYHAIRYVNTDGACWTVDNVEVRHPRLVLRLGEVWNGDKAGISSTP